MAFLSKKEDVRYFTHLSVDSPLDYQKHTLQGVTEDILLSSTKTTQQVCESRRHETLHGFFLAKSAKAKGVLLEELTYVFICLFLDVNTHHISFNDVSFRANQE